MALLNLPTEVKFLESDSAAWAKTVHVFHRGKTMGIITNLQRKMAPLCMGGVWLNDSMPSSWLFVSLFACLIFWGWLLAWRKRKMALALMSGLGARGQGAIASYRRSLPQLRFALSRARRYQHPITLAVMSLGREQLVQSIRNLAGGWTHANLASHFYFSFIGSLLRDNLRESDIVTYDAAADQYVLLLTETPAAEAKNAILRLNGLVFKHTAVYLRIGIAEFPVDGLIVEDLVTCAQAKCNGQSISVDWLPLEVSNSLAAPATGAPIHKSNGTNGVAKSLAQMMS
jgi:hypothetical protein